MVTTESEEKTMSAKERLHKVQAALAEKGAVDVKFFLSANPTEDSLTKVATDAAAFLEATLDPKKVKPMAPFGDSIRQAK